MSFFQGERMGFPSKKINDEFILWFLCVWPDILALVLFLISTIEKKRSRASITVREKDGVEKYIYWFPSLILLCCVMQSEREWSESGREASLESSKMLCFLSFSYCTARSEKKREHWISLSLSLSLSLGIPSPIPSLLLFIDLRT